MTDAITINCDDNAQAGAYEVVYDSKEDGNIGTAEQEVEYGVTSYGFQIQNEETSGSKIVYWRFGTTAGIEKGRVNPGSELKLEPSQEISVFISASHADTAVTVRIRKANT